MSTEVITPFTFSDLPAPVAAELQAITSRIKERLVRQVSDIIETGRDLIEVKSKLQHGQFEAWLNTSFNMTMRTAQKYMRAAEWMADKSELSSYLTPTTIYMLSAKNTPEGVHEQVVERLEKGLPAEPEYVRMVVQEAKISEREAKNRKGNREARDARKRTEGLPEEIKNQRERRRAKARAQKQHKKKEQRERLELAANFYCRAGEMAGLLRDEKKLNETEIGKMFSEFDAVYKRLRVAIIEHSLGDNVTVFPPKPWESS